MKAGKRFVRWLTAGLAGILLVGAVGCGKKTEEPPEGTSGVTEEATTAAAGSYEESVPKRDYENAIFRVLCSTEMDPFFDDEKAYIDKVKEAVLRRNEMTCSLYNVDVRYTSMSGNYAGADAFAAKIRAICNGGDDAYDLVLPQARFGVPLGLEGLYYDFSESESLQWEQPWYYQNINENCTVMEQTYYLASAYLIDKIFAAEVVLYNVDLGNRYGISVDTLYDAVRNGTWTIGMLRDCAAEVPVSADSSEQAVWGCVMGGHGVRALLVGCDTPFVTKEDGRLKVTYYNDHLVAAYDLVNAFVNQSPYVGCDDTDALLQCFINGSSLFAVTYLGMMGEESNLTSEVDFSILPIPKFSENQTAYITDVQRWEMVSVPVTAEAERACLVLDALSYYSYTELLPTYWSYVVGTKLTRDPRVKEIVETIRASITYDFCAVYQVEMGEIYLGTDSLSNSIRRGGTEGISSWWGRLGPSSDQWFDALCLKFEELANKKKGK